MKSTLIKDYYQKTQLYRRRNDSKGLSRFLEEQKEVLGLIPRYATLIQGESAYYQGKYAAALKHYLAIPDVEDQRFFCYRATAFLCFEQKNYSKAFSYAKKTLKLEPKEYDILQLLYRLLDVIHTCEHRPEYIDDHDSDSELNYVPVAEKELEELTNIF
ncbi:MAG: hypothetical protein H7A37_09515 [Chlamydiales bacterium]|nr:hypothetical protein [Chlamydiia bacterium]MCP5508515.1 hypothetical protein [Chlamydiales bacterium]